MDVSGGLLGAHSHGALENGALDRLKHKKHSQLRRQKGNPKFAFKYTILKMFALKMHEFGKLPILSVRNVETISRNTQIPKITSLIFKSPCRSVYFRLHSVSVLLSECDE